MEIVVYVDEQKMSRADSPDAHAHLDIGCTQMAQLPDPFVAHQNSSKYNLFIYLFIYFYYFLFIVWIFIFLKSLLKHYLVW